MPLSTGSRTLLTCSSGDKERQGEDGKVVFEVGAGSWWVPPAMSIHTVDAGETLSSGCEFQSSRNSRTYESKEFSTRSESHSKGSPGQRRSASSRFPGHDRRLGLDASIDDGEKPPHRRTRPSPLVIPNLLPIRTSFASPWASAQLYTHIVLVLLHETPLIAFNHSAVISAHIGRPVLVLRDRNVAYTNVSSCLSSWPKWWLLRAQGENVGGARFADAESKHARYICGHLRIYSYFNTYLDGQPYSGSIPLNS